MNGDRRRRREGAIVPPTQWQRLAFTLVVVGPLTLSSCGGDRRLPNNPVAPTTVPRPGTPASVTAALTIDFLNVANYAAPNLPVHYDSAVAALDNAGGAAINDRVATLGRVLFYDKNLSINNSTSCASCHLQASGFTDARQFSVGFAGAQTAAHAPRLGNVRYWAPGTMFWDRRAHSLEAQASDPITNAIELGFTAGLPLLIAKMNGIAYYPELFTFAFDNAAITEQRIQQAMAQFERAMISSASRWDAAYAQIYTPGSNLNLFVDFPGFTAEENRGRALFMNNATAGTTCAACHVPPTFALNANAGSNGLDAGETTRFKAPSLKNVARSGAFMHDGRFATLDQVLDHYASGIQSGPALDNRLRDRSGGVTRFKLSGDDKAAIVAFLRTLDDPDLTTEPRFSDPFR